MHIPNNDTPGNRAANGYLPLSRHPDPVHPSNTTSDRRAGVVPLAGSTGAVKPPNHPFAVGHSGNPPAPAMAPAQIPTQPGHGGPVGGSVPAPNGLDLARADMASVLRSPLLPR